MTKALIIGGGIAGPVAAMALEKAGIRADIAPRWFISGVFNGAVYARGSAGTSEEEWHGRR